MNEPCIRLSSFKTLWTFAYCVLSHPRRPKSKRGFVDRKVMRYVASKVPTLLDWRNNEFHELWHTRLHSGMYHIARSSPKTCRSRPCRSNRNKNLHRLFFVSTIFRSRTPVKTLIVVHSDLSNFREIERKRPSSRQFPKIYS